MATIRRLWGYKSETGTPQSYDDLVSGAIPDADTFFPVTGGDIDFGIERIDRDDEVRGRRARTRPRPFRAGPGQTVPLRAYRSAVERIARKCFGGVDTPTGTAPASITHDLAILGFGSTALPTISTQTVRDELNQKMSGGSINRMSLSFPLDGEGTMEFEVMGLYAAHFGTAAPTVSFTGLSDDVLMLRDAQVFLDGNVVAVLDLQAFDFSFTNNLTRKWFAKRNVVTQVIGTPTATHKLWYPEENKLGAAQDVTYAIQFGEPNAAQELAHHYAQVQKIVFEVTGGPLGTTPAATELLRITLYNAVHTDGGADGLAAREDLTARYEGGAFYSDADSADVKFEVVNATATALT